MDFSIVISLEERVITLCVLVLGSFLPLCFFSGIIISSLGIADNINRATFHSKDMATNYKIYIMCAVMLLIVSFLGCICISCTILYKLREPCWEKRRCFYHTNVRRVSQITFSESAVLTQASTPPPVYSSLNI